MIDEYILKTLESNTQDPSYSVVIDSFDLENSFCNKDRIKINLQQINPNIEEIIETQQNDIEILKAALKAHNITIPTLGNLNVNSVINKTLIIDSSLDVNKEDEMFVSKLNTFLDKETSQPVRRNVCLGQIKNHNIDFIDKDYPNYFNRSKFRIVNDNLIIKIPKKVNQVLINIKKGSNTSVYTTDDIVDNQITIPIPDNYAIVYDFRIQYSLNTSVTTKHIESITTPLSRVIEVQFEKAYNEIPSVILTIDKEDKVYSSYDLSFETNESNKYTSVTITFNKFKRSMSYGNINVTIIGD